jgi:hypothetical protein
MVTPGPKHRFARGLARLSQASDSWAGVAFLRCAQVRTRSAKAMLACSTFGANRGETARKSGVSKRLAAFTPPAKNPMPSSSHRGNNPRYVLTPQELAVAQP